MVSKTMLAKCSTITGKLQNIFTYNYGKSAQKQAISAWCARNWTLSNSIAKKTTWTEVAVERSSLSAM